MRAATLLAVILLAAPLVCAAEAKYTSPLSVLEEVLSKSNFSIFDSLLESLNLSSLPAGGSMPLVGNRLPNASSLGGFEMPSSGSLGEPGLLGGLPEISIPKPPQIIIPAQQLRMLAALAIILVYVFAAGKIADFLQSTGRKITKREALLAPLALMLAAAIAISFYFATGLSRPPQNTLITNIVYLALVPSALAIAAGALVLYGFFRDRLNAVQSLDLALRIVLAPFFDGMRGYWTALSAAAVLALISTIVFYSSGGQLALATFDFLLLSIIAAVYFLYRAATAQGNEGKASNFVTAMCILAPSILERFFRDIACAVLAQVPFGIFSSCPLNSTGSEVSLALSVGATMLLLLPVVPIVYAFAVNLLRALTLASLLLRREPKAAAKEGDAGEASGEVEEGPEDGTAQQSGGGRPRIEEWKPKKARGRGGRE